MRRRLISGAFALACCVGLSIPSLGASGAATTSAAKTCTIIHHDETKLVWNAGHTKQLREVVYQVVPETALLDGHKSYVKVAVAVVVSQRVCLA